MKDSHLQGKVAAWMEYLEQESSVLCVRHQDKLSKLEKHNDPSVYIVFCGLKLSCRGVTNDSGLIKVFFFYLC